MVEPVLYHAGKFPPRNIQWDQLTSLIGPAHAALAKFDNTLSVIPNAHVLLTPLSTQEAVLSSRIEGTQATLGEVFEYEAGMIDEKFTQERKDDILEIIQYRSAMNHATELLKEIPLCLRVIKESHKVLMQHVRGASKSPGKFRTIPNWIGPPGCKQEEAKFIPISADKLTTAMGEWEKYLHAEEKDRLVQLAILHAEFEALHPFLDGNGRLGRMLIPLFLYNIDLLKEPVFYISAYFEKNRDTYYEKLLAVSREDDWTGFCRFFLEAVIKQAKENQTKANAIIQLYETKKEKIVELTHSQYSIKALDFIFKRPFFLSSEFVNEAGIPIPTAKRILGVLIKEGILQECIKSSGRRPSLLDFPKLQNIVEGREEFVFELE